MDQNPTVWRKQKNIIQIGEFIICKVDVKRFGFSRLVTIPPLPPEYVNFFEPFHFLAGDHLVVPIGASHISSWLQEI